MLKLVAIAGCILAVFSSYAAAFHFGRNYENTKITAEVKSEQVEKLLKWAEADQKAKQQIMGSLADLAQFNDADVGDATKFAYSRMRDLRKPKLGVNTAGAAE